MRFSAKLDNFMQLPRPVNDALSPIIREKKLMNRPWYYVHPRRDNAGLAFNDINKTLRENGVLFALKGPLAKPKRPVEEEEFFLGNYLINYLNQFKHLFEEDPFLHMQVREIKDRKTGEVLGHLFWEEKPDGINAFC